MTFPVTSLHYAPNGNFPSGGGFAPGAAGFNLADVSSLSVLNALPAGVKGLVYLGATSGADAAFQAKVAPFMGNPKLYGFFLVDEPIPTNAGGTVTPANLKAESDYIHAHFPGVKTFITLYNEGPPTTPVFGPNNFNANNTGIDLFGIGSYPVRPEFSGGVNYTVINAGVSAAVASGISVSAIVPIYQAFGATSGAYVSWGIPTAAQLSALISVWATLTPNPAFDMAYSWGTQQGDLALATLPALQAVFSAQYMSSAPTSTRDQIIAKIQGNLDAISSSLAALR